MESTSFSMKQSGLLITIFMILVLADARGLDVDTAPGEAQKHPRDLDQDREKEDDGRGLPKLSRHEQQILHALFGGIGE